jgi:hypothetical protein
VRGGRLLGASFRAANNFTLRYLRSTRRRGFLGAECGPRFPQVSFNTESSCPEPRDALKDTYEYLKGLYPDKQWEPDPDPRCEACAQVGYLFFGAAHRSTVRGRIVREAERPSERLVTDTLVGMWQALPAADKGRWAKTRMHTRGGAPNYTRGGPPRRRRRRKRRFDHGL